MRLGALLLLTLLSAGCVTAGDHDPGDRDKSQETWVGHWDTLADRNPERGLTVLRKGEHLTLSLVRVKAGEPLDFSAHGHVLIMVEGQGLLEVGAGSRESLEPGSVAVISPGTARLHAGREIHGLLITGAKVPKNPIPAPPQVLPIEALFPQDLLEPPGRMREVARVPGVSVHPTAMLKLAGLQRHVHLKHDVVLFFLSGGGTLGLGSEAQGKTSAGSTRDRQLKRGFASSPVEARAIALLPAGAPHSFVNEEFRETLVLVLYGPDFDGYDGHSIPDAKPRSEAPTKWSKKG